MRVATELAKELNSYKVETKFLKIPLFKAKFDDSYDVVIVCYPVHAFNAPAPVIKFLNALPCAKKAAYLLRTSGEPLKFNDASGITPKRILRKKGYCVKAEFSYVMPYNIIFKHTNNMASRMWNCAKNKILRDANVIMRGINSLKSVNISQRVVSFVLRIERIAMPIIGKTFKANKNLCVKCGKCVAVCPTCNIELKSDFPVFGSRCVGCMACSFFCPKDAVKTSVLNGWRVNGEYDFSASAATDDEVCKYCRKSYLRYFHENETER